MTDQQTNEVIMEAPPASTAKYVLQVNPYTITSAQIALVLNMLGVVISADVYDASQDEIKSLFKVIN